MVLHRKHTTKQNKPNKVSQMPFVLDRFCLEDNILRSLEMTIINRTVLPIAFIVCLLSKKLLINNDEIKIMVQREC